jgi:hypothetical protein
MSWFDRFDRESKRGFFSEETAMTPVRIHLTLPALERLLGGDIDAQIETRIKEGINERLAYALLIRPPTK